MISSSLDQETRITLRRWSLEGFYIYVRPVSSALIDSANKPRQYWSVSVELRTTPPGQWRGEGYNLDEVIQKLASEVPHNRSEHRDQNAGWLAPESVLQKQIKQMHKKRKKKSKR